jgi:lipid A 3-O-deacylase
MKPVWPLIRNCLLGIALLGVAVVAAAAESELAVTFGRATDSHETDVARLSYRRALSVDSRWWWPQQVQFGVGVWREPDPQGQTRRYEASVTPIWRRENSTGYLEGGIGAYLLSHTISNDKHQLGSSFQFGSHIGAGVFLGKARVGLGLQHISNAGIKKPNGGINLYLLSASVPL